MNPEDMPGWEGDFWRELLDEARPTGRFASGGWHTPTDQHYEMFEGDTVEGVSEFWTEDTLVGEIVEDEPLALANTMKGIND